MTTTHRIAINGDTYTNVSNGNINCTLVCAPADELRILVGPSDREPNPDTEDYIVLDGNKTSTITVTNLEGEADLWVRGERHDTDVCVVRGPAVLLVSG